MGQGYFRALFSHSTRSRGEERRVSLIFPHIVKVFGIIKAATDDPQRIPGAVLKHRGTMIEPDGKTGGGGHFSPFPAVGAFPHIVFIGTVIATDNPQRITGAVIKHCGGMFVPCGKNGTSDGYFSPVLPVGTFPYILQAVATTNNPQCITGAVIKYCGGMTEPAGKTGVGAADNPQCITGAVIKYCGGMTVPYGKNAAVGGYFSPVLAVGTFPHIVQIAVKTLPADNPQCITGAVIKYCCGMTEPAGKIGGSGYPCPCDAVGAFPHIVQMTVNIITADDPQRIPGAVLKHRAALSVPCGKNRLTRLPVSKVRCTLSLNLRILPLPLNLLRRKG
ncbi:hypothetical protein CHS0354_035248 [Potamilus streckersoni]|uniref:Uncharacterized protein n=1 Tax=Potamilus streckersoni TaxID=2493646 RepID=A0AAE0S2F1_9BIVA|nr:hypothetical protein CHS0354_035248 [Potamilus streckersoni]